MNKLWALVIYAGTVAKAPILQTEGYIDEQTCYDTAGRAAQIIADKTKAKPGELWFLCVPVQGPEHRDAVWPWVTPPTPSIAEEVRKANLAAAAAADAAEKAADGVEPSTSTVKTSTAPIAGPAKKP